MVTPPVDRPTRLRRLILEQSKRANVGHIGSALSIAEIIDVVVNEAARGLGSDDPDRDRLVLSKGHAALALYCALNLRGAMTDHELNTYCADGGLLGVHPEHTLPGIDFSTGSLGMGLSVGAGSALGARMRGSPSRTYVVVSDAELNEGQTWEAIMFAAHHRLDGLTAILDNNHQQALAPTAAVIDLGDIGAKLDAFGWDVRVVNGHDCEELRAALNAPRRSLPRAIVAETVSGRGVSFMEGRVEWHYLPMSDAQYAQAVAGLGT